jgi:hypothetical protein
MPISALNLRDIEQLITGYKSLSWWNKKLNKPSLSALAEDQTDEDKMYRVCMELLEKPKWREPTGINFMIDVWVFIQNSKGPKSTRPLEIFLNSNLMQLLSRLKRLDGVITPETFAAILKHKKPDLALRCFKALTDSQVRNYKSIILNRDFSESEAKEVLYKLKIIPANKSALRPSVQKDTINTPLLFRKPKTPQKTIDNHIHVMDLSDDDVTEANTRFIFK